MRHDILFTNATCIRERSSNGPGRRFARKVQAQLREHMIKLPDETSRPQVVDLKCRVCEWQAAMIARPGEVIDCPWCHGPTTVISVRVPVQHRGDKNPHAAALGRLGGLKGGPARAAVLSAQQRRAIAVKAAKTRWKKKKK